MANNSQSRKWLLVINNPLSCGFTNDAITEILMLFSPEYFCLSNEIGKTGTFHVHIFLYSPSPIRFTTLKNRFPIAHIEKAYGSASQNRDYVLKSGKWADSDKSKTIVEGSFCEYGNIPTEKEEKNPQMFQLIQNIRDGMSTVEIIDGTPNMAFRIRDIDALRQTILSEKYATENRKIEVCYIFGASGTGKTRSIYQRHNGREICRITNYRIGQGISFDGYYGQDVLVFEEFHSQIPVEDMLNYLDIYPLMLPARYSDKTACFTKVYITSNTPLYKQYKEVQMRRPETWNAFSRRIHKIVEYSSDGTVKEKINSSLGGVKYN